MEQQKLSGVMKIRLYVTICYLGVSLGQQIEGSDGFVDHGEWIREDVPFYRTWIVRQNKILVRTGAIANGKQSVFELNESDIYRVYLSHFDADAPIETRCFRSVKGGDIVNGISLPSLFSEMGSVAVFNIPSKISHFLVMDHDSDDNVGRSVYFRGRSVSGWLPVSYILPGNYVLIPFKNEDGTKSDEAPRLISVAVAALKKRGQDIQRYDWTKLSAVPDRVYKSLDSRKVSVIEEIVRTRDTMNEVTPDSR